MVVEGGPVPADVLAAEEQAKNHVAPHVNFYDPSAYKVNECRAGRGYEGIIESGRTDFEDLP